MKFENFKYRRYLTESYNGIPLNMHRRLRAGRTMSPSGFKVDVNIYWHVNVENSLIHRIRYTSEYKLKSAWTLIIGHLTKLLGTEDGRNTYLEITFSVGKTVDVPSGIFITDLPRGWNQVLRSFRLMGWSDRRMTEKLRNDHQIGILDKWYDVQSFMGARGKLGEHGIVDFW